MKRHRHTPEQVIRKIREGEKLLNEGKAKRRAVKRPAPAAAAPRPPKVAVVRRYGAKTHCPRGHPYAGENLYVDPKGNKRCRECRGWRGGGFRGTHRRNPLEPHDVQALGGIQQGGSAGRHLD